MGYTLKPGTHYPYIRAINMARIYGLYIRVSKMTPEYTARIYGRTFCARTYGLYIRVTSTHYPNIRPVYMGAKSALIYMDRMYG